MNKNEADLAHQRLCAQVATWILALSGVVALFAAVSGESHGLKAWLLPFGPWSCALIAFGFFRRRGSALDR
jgi:hypothetical protein